MRHPLSPAPFHRRAVAGAVLRSGAVIGLSLLIGVVGLHLTEDTPWIDALLGAAMILTGMGPTVAVQSTAGKLFLTAYALFSGVVFLGAVALLFQPIFHRLLHRFHLELSE